MAIERIQLRRGTTVEWNDANPVLAFGEPGVEVKTDTTLSVKIGDGSSTWSALPYFGELEGDFVTPTELSSELSSYSTTSQMNSAINTSVSAGLAGLVDSAPTTLDTLNELATALGDDPNFATTIATSIGDLETDVGTLQNDVVNAQNDAFTALSISGSNQSEISTLLAEVDRLESSKSDIEHSHLASEVSVPIKEVADTVYNLLSTDNGKLLAINPSGGVTTISVDNTFSVGDRVDIFLQGTQVVFSAGSGVTLQSAGTEMNTQYSVASIVCISSGIYAVIGSIE